MAKIKNSCVCVLFLLCFIKQGHAQLPVSFVPTAVYDCVSGLANTGYNIYGGTTPYSYTIVNAVSGATVATGFITVVPIGTVAPLPVGNYNIYILDPNGLQGFSPNYQNTVPYIIANPIATTASITCFGANNGSASVIPPTSFNANPNYTWMPGSINTPTINNMAAGDYTVSISDAKGCKVSTVVTISEPPPITSTLALDSIVCYGQTLNTTITTTGNVGATTYTVNGLPILQNNAIGLVAGIQTIITRDSKGCVKTNTVLVRQGNQPVVTFYKVTPNCPGGSDGSLYAQSTTGVPPPFQYTWQPGNIYNANAANIAAGTYTLHLSYINGLCSYSTVTTLTPAIGPNVNSLTNPENCSATDGAYTLNVSGVPPPFTYSTLPFGVQPGNSRSNLSSGVYTVLTGYNFNINNNTYCVDTTLVTIGNLSTVSVSIQNSVPVLCNGSCNASITLNVVNAVTPITYSATGNLTTTANSFTNLCAGFYTIRAVDGNGCPATTTINLLAPPALTFTPTVASSSVCAGKAASLQGNASGGTGSYTYIWKPGNVQGQFVNLVPAATTVYSLNAYDANGCTTGAKQITVTVAAPLSININSSSSGICPGTTAQITPTVSGGDGAYTYNWLPGNTTGPSIFVQNITIPVYTVVVTDGCGSQPVTKLITINLFPATRPEFTAKSLRGCAPFCTVFMNKTPKATNVSWNFGDSQTAKWGDTLRYCYATDGRFNISLSLVDSNFCVASYCYTNAVQVLKSPHSDFTTDPKYVTFMTAANVLFKNLTEDAVDYQWNVDEGYYGKNKDINFDFADTGCYKVRLISENKSGCADTLVKYICVHEDFNLYMPNCFTPDGNGNNDVLIPKGTGWLETNYLFEIYDRWGSRVFNTSDTKGGWDGSHSGSDAPFSLYIWKIKVTDLKGTEHKLAGSVSLVR